MISRRRFGDGEFRPGPLTEEVEAQVPTHRLVGEGLHVVENALRRALFGHILGFLPELGVQLSDIVGSARAGGRRELLVHELGPEVPERRQDLLIGQELLDGTPVASLFAQHDVERGTAGLGPERGHQSARVRVRIGPFSQDVIEVALEGLGMSRHPVTHQVRHREPLMEPVGIDQEVIRRLGAGSLHGQGHQRRLAGHEGGGRSRSGTRAGRRRAATHQDDQTDEHQNRKELRHGKDPPFERCIFLKEIIEHLNKKASINILHRHLLPPAGSKALSYDILRICVLDLEDDFLKESATRLP